MRREGKGFVMMVAVLLAAAPALAWNEPADFRGVRWGASVEEAKATIPDLACVPLMGTCREFFEIGPARVYAFWAFRNGGFDQVNLTFESPQYDEVRAMFTERYGEPTARRTEAIALDSATTLENEILEWTGDTIYAELRRFVKGIDRGAATIRTKAGLEEAARRRGAGPRSH